MDIQSRVNEFCKKGNLEEFRDILIDIFTRIKEAGCRISCADSSDIKKSSHFFEPCMIRIPIHVYVANPIDIIWIILHEFGHHKSGSITKSEYTYEVMLIREKEAWDYAREEAKRMPSLSKYINEFEECAKRNFETYK